MTQRERISKFVQNLLDDHPTDGQCAVVLGTQSSENDESSNTGLCKNALASSCKDNFGDCRNMGVCGSSDNSKICLNVPNLNTRGPACIKD